MLLLHGFIVLTFIQDPDGDSAFGISGRLLLLVILFYMALLNVIYLNPRRRRDATYWQRPRGIDWFFYPVREGIITIDNIYRTPFEQKVGRLVGALMLVVSVLCTVLYVSTLTDAGR